MRAQAQEVAARLRAGGRGGGGGDPFPCAWAALASDMLAGELAAAHGRAARSVAWRAACGTLPLADNAREAAETWPAITADLRREYEALRDSLVVDPDDAADDGDFDPLGGDPLGAAATRGAGASRASAGASDGAAAAAGANPWEEYHKDRELLEEIRKDLERLFPTGCDELFFMQPDVVKVLQGVLFTWSKLHPDTSYRQGMHELAAPMLFCLHGDAVAAEASREQGDDGLSSLSEPEKLLAMALISVLDKKYLEHDLFWIFERVMRDMKPMFAVAANQLSQRDIRKAKEAMVQASKKNRALGSGVGSSRQTSAQQQQQQQQQEGGASESPGLPPAPVTPILIVADEIQNVLLGKVDGALQRHLRDLTIEPQIYALRWIRLLFGREFSIQQVMVLWDALFAEAFGLQDRIQNSRQDQVKAAEIARAARSAAVTRLGPFSLDAGPGGPGLPRIACYVAVALLTFVRKDLLEAGYNEALMLLMKYPVVDDAHAFVHLAFNLKNSLEPESHGRPTVVPPKSVPAASAVSADPGRTLASAPGSQLDARPGPGPGPAPVAAPNDSAALGYTSGPALTTSPPRPVADAGPSPQPLDAARALAQTTSAQSTEKRKGSSPLGSFFKEIGETIEHMLEPEKGGNVGAGASKQAAELVASQRALGARLGAITSEMQNALGQDHAASKLQALIGEANAVRDALLQASAALP